MPHASASILRQRPSTNTIHLVNPLWDATGGADLRTDQPDRLAKAMQAGINLMPAGSLPSDAFLSSLDAFHSRTHPAYLEGFGRVVLEAMLCGLPVVAEARGGYAEHIRHG